MKKSVTLFLCVLAMVACTKKTTIPSAEDNAAAIAAYHQLEDDMNAAMEAAETEEEAEIAFSLFLENAKSLLEQNKGGELVYVALPDLYYYLTTVEKTAAFEGVCPDSLTEGRLARKYQAYLAELSTTVGCAFTDFACATPAGDTLALKDVVGTKDFVLVDFWASWCGPCRRSMPEMKTVYEEFGGRLEILGVSLDDNRERWIDCIERLELPWLHVSDLQGWSCAPAAQYGVCSIPATILIDKEGRIVARNAELEELRAILAQ